MSKTYAIVSTVENGELAGVFAPGNTPYPGKRRDITREERELLREELVRRFGEANTAQKFDRTGYDPDASDPVQVFDLRKDARACADVIGTYNWHVIEFGSPEERDVRPVLRWKFECRDTRNGSAEWSTSFAEPCATRKEARADLRTLKAGGAVTGLEYRTVPVYGAWRCDPTYDGRSLVGSLRFRTKRAAEEFGEREYSVPGKDYEVNLHESEVEESRLYVPA